MDLCFSSSSLSVRRSKSSVTNYYPVRRSYSSADLSGTSADDVIDFARPWYSKYYTGSKDDFWFYRLYYGSRSSPAWYFRAHRETPYKYWSTMDPLYYRRPYYDSTSTYPSRWWLTPAYYESKYYDYAYRAFNWYPYSWYYPRRYYYDFYY